MNKPENYKLVDTSYSKNDVIVLLKDLTGKITALDTEEREKLNQSGKHYSEMLPVEYKPTKEYLKIYNEILEMNKEKLAKAIIDLSKKIYNRFCGEDKIYLVSLARAGTPIGILLKRTIEEKFKIKVEHYSISIIRGKGIDVNAMRYICLEAQNNPIIFVDGWIGKGAIQRELTKSVVLDLKGKTFECKYSRIDDRIYSISDPGYVNDDKYCGTREDFMIPSACLNATVNGLFSRTIRNELIKDDDFDGSVSYKELKDNDLSLKFINEIMEEINKIEVPIQTGISIVEKIANDYNVKDIYKVKPGIGETIRVLLRRVPNKVLISSKNKMLKELNPVIELCKEKNVDIEYVKNDYLGNYKCVGIIKEMSDL